MTVHNFKIVKNKGFDEDCFQRLLNMGSTELNENGTHEKGYSVEVSADTPKHLKWKVAVFQIRARSKLFVIFLVL